MVSGKKRLTGHRRKPWSLRPERPDLSKKTPPSLSPSTAHARTAASNFDKNLGKRGGRKARFSLRLSLACGCAWRVCVHARGPSRCGAHACLGGASVFGGPRECESVSLFVSLSLSVSRASPSAIADFLTLSLTASLCLSPSVRLSRRLPSSLVPLLPSFFS